MRRVLLAAALLLAAVPLPAMKSPFVWDVAGASVSRGDGGALTVSVDFDIMSDAVARGSAVVLQPYLVCGGRRADLRPLSFYSLGRRGGLADVRGDGTRASGRDDELVFVGGGSSGRKHYAASAEGFGVPGRDSVELMVGVTEYRRGGRRGFGETRKVACFLFTPEPEFHPDFVPLYPSDGGAVRRSVTLTLRPQYGAGGTFDVGRGGNAAMMYEFLTSVTPLVNAGVVKGVTLLSYGGVEGPESANRKAAEARLASLWKYLRTEKVFGGAKVTRRTVGEDWASVARWLDASALHGDAVARAVIDGAGLSKDAREKKLRGCGAVWGAMSGSLFPSLERVECVVEYELKPYADDAARWEAYYGSPLLLSPGDYGVLMRASALWGGAFCELALDFAEAYPESPEAHVDAFGAAMVLGNAREASKHLRVMGGGDAALYCRALWLMYCDDTQGALDAVNAMKGKDAAYAATARRIGEIRAWRLSTTPDVARLYRRYPRR